jgi:DNA-binding transcriptional ArsR family regulator
MLAMSFNVAAALARVRFGISPMFEVTRSVRLLNTDDVPLIHRTWARAAQERSSGIDLAVLRALQPPGAYAPDFINPPPGSPVAKLDDELLRMAATPAERVAHEIERAYRGSEIPSILEPFVCDPERALRELAGTIRAFWDRALAPDWPRLRALLEGDALYRARQIADGGADRFFSDIDPAVSWHDGIIRVRKTCCSIDLKLEQQGLLFVPSAFVLPEVEVITAAPWQPTLIYPARGVATLWEPGERAAGESLVALLGRRGETLAALEEPLSTTSLARRLSITPGGASQHLKVLRAAGLVQRHRLGRVVLYARSETGEAVVRAAAAPE